MSTEPTELDARPTDAADDKGVGSADIGEAKSVAGRRHTAARSRTLSGGLGPVASGLPHYQLSISGEYSTVNSDTQPFTAPRAPQPATHPCRLGIRLG